ncbi:EAP30/Vps36 family-domain-containing protein [Coprinopsis sp. MPI-PUGE-AT-0042]|nr:EAP30/Vps36 family-domain-containing protein [Coprinopsis sp. MPI-PUGE-AT-0042]
MVLKRYTREVDGTIPVQALLYDDEELLASQDSVGIYDGAQKSPEHQNGVVSVTSHRLFYIDAQRGETRSFVLDLSTVTQTEYYAGLFTSSPKLLVTIRRTGEPMMGLQPWECQVCGHRNPPGLSPAAGRICGLCGVPREALSDNQGSHSRETRPISASLPSSGLAIPASKGYGTPPSGVADLESTDDSTTTCPACTFHNHPSLRRCEMCDTELPRRPSRSRSQRQLKSAPGTRPTSPDRESDDPAVRFIKLSFRKGGDKSFYAALKRSLQGKAWEVAKNQAGQSSSARPNAPSVGISGILRTVEHSAQNREDNIQDALQDLEALMVKAKDMVRLAAELNEKLTAASASATSSTPTFGSPSTSANPEPEEATFIRSSLSQLGLQLENAPVTQDMMKDEKKWYEELARELGVVLQGSGAKRGMMRERGIVALDEVWGGWNRARGVALIPPSTFLQVLPLVPRCTNPPIQQRTFSSGLQVLHTPPYSREAFTTRLSGYLVMNGPKTTMEIALEEGGIGLGGLHEDADGQDASPIGLPVALVREMVESGEADGDFVRDDVGEAAIVGGGSGTGAEVRWWPNVFVGYAWDGQE